MKKLFFVIFCASLLSFSCSKKICPAYQSVRVYEQSDNKTKYKYTKYSMFGKKLKGKTVTKVVYKKK